MDAAEWDRRYAAAPLVWSAGPNALFADLTADLPPGRALDLAAGEGRTSLWLAERGWRVTAVDFSAIGIDKGARRAAELGLDVEWVVADVTTAGLEHAAYDLVVLLYLHLAEPLMGDVLGRGITALAPGGTIVVIGHDRDNVDHGVGGPQDPDLLHTTDLLGRCADGLDVLRLEQVLRPVEAGTAIDTLLLARRPWPPSPASADHEEMARTGPAKGHMTGESGHSSS